MGNKICLNMIVKNESAVIERCLSSLRDHIDAWVIVDTGSTDDTKEKIREILKGIPGALHERPWRNFGSNRSEAVALAYESGCDYFLFFDADDVLLAPPGFSWPALDAHVYELMLVYGNYRYARAALVSSKLHWRWVGVLHEYAVSIPITQSRKALSEPTIRASTDGARSRDPNKYDRDAEALLKGLADEPGNTRYQFYLAQSYRDAGKPEQALIQYEKRAVMGGWDEEVWCSLLEVARLTERLARPHDEVIAAYLRAFVARPTRAEPLVALARLSRLKGQFAHAYLYAKHAVTLPLPPDRLFVETMCYSFSALDELAIAAYWTGRFAECKTICDDLLARNAVPAQDIARVNANREFAITKLH